MITNSITIYDYDNNPTIVNIPEKEIDSIWIRILSGDETGDIEFKDGTSVSFDASHCRMMSFDDGGYVVKGDAICKWINWKPCEGCHTFSYDRQYDFS